MLPIRGASKRTGKPDRKAGAQSHGTDSGPPGYRKERGNPMKGKTKKIVLAVAVIGAIAAGGVAFTDSNTVVASVAGYGTAHVTGATTTDINHTLAVDGKTITSTVITFDADQTGNTVAAGFGTDDLTPCVVTTTTATCTWLPAQDTVAAQDFNVAVSH
jgi:hypothetical protein